MPDRRRRRREGLKGSVHLQQSCLPLRLIKHPNILVERSGKFRNIRPGLHSYFECIITIIPLFCVIIYAVQKVSLNNLRIRHCRVCFRNGIAERLDEGSQPPVRNHVVSPEDNINVVVRWGSVSCWVWVLSALVAAARSGLAVRLWGHANTK